MEVVECRDREDDVRVGRGERVRVDVLLIVEAWGLKDDGERDRRRERGQSLTRCGASRLRSGTMAQPDSL